MKYILLLSSLVAACPQFVEILPDPTDVADQQGEFVEIRMDKTFHAESLLVVLDEKVPLKFAYPEGERFIVSHGNVLCPGKAGVSCGDLGNYTLPNSRETVWKLMAGSCTDSVKMDKPKPGKSFQRRGYGDQWAIDEPTPGYGNPLYERDLDDCGVSRVEYEFRGDHWWVSGKLSGCKNAWLRFHYRDLFHTNVSRMDSLLVNEFFSFALPVKGPAHLHLRLPEDEIEFNNAVDTLLFQMGNSPLIITEIHHCPEEPVPEWVEVYNASGVSLPLSKVRHCSRGGFWGGTGDSIGPYESVLVSRDTAALREQLAYRDVNLIQASIGYLNNTAGTFSLCFGDAVMDSAGWDKGTVGCPLGFNPKTGLAENTPGFQGKNSERYGEEPFRYKFSSRVLRKRGEPLRVKVEGEREVMLSLLDSAGQTVWKQKAPAMSNAWWNIPVQEYVGVGAAYIKMSSGSFEKVVGIVVRP